MIKKSIFFLCLQSHLYRLLHCLPYTEERLTNQRRAGSRAVKFAYQVANRIKGIGRANQSGKINIVVANQRRDCITCLLEGAVIKLTLLANQRRRNVYIFKLAKNVKAKLFIESKQEQSGTQAVL